MRNHHVRKPYNPCRKWRLLGAIPANDPKIPQNTRFSVKVDGVLRRRKPYKLNGKWFLKSQKRVAENLIKPVENWWFWMHFGAKAPKTINKPLVKPYIRNAFSRRRKTLINSTENAISRKPQTHCENPYETCLKLMISKPFAKKRTPKSSKIMRIFWVSRVMRSPCRKTL